MKCREAWYMILFSCMSLCAMQKEDVEAVTDIVPYRSSGWDSQLYDTLFKKPPVDNYLSIAPQDIRSLIQRYIFQEEIGVTHQVNEWIAKNADNFSDDSRLPIQNLYFYIVCSQHYNELLAPLIRRLHVSGADINRDDYYCDRIRRDFQPGSVIHKCKPLMYAASDRERFSLLKALVECEGGGDINARDEVTGKTALRYAYEGASRKGIRLLLKYGADPKIKDAHEQDLFDGRLTRDHDGYYNLIFASGTQSRHHSAIIPTVYALYDTYFEARYQDICSNLKENSYRDAIGDGISFQSLVSWAARYGQGEVVYYCLLNSLIPVTTICPLTRNSLLMDAVLGGDTALIINLLEKGIDPNHQNDLGQTALMFAAQKGNNVLLKRLCAAGAHMENVDYLGKTALLYALRARNKEGVCFLLHAGANADIESKRETAITLAAELNDLSLIQLLVQKGARLLRSFENQLGYIALFHRLCQICRSPEIIEYILQQNKGCHEIDTHDESDSWGRTALCHIVENGVPAQVDVLVTYGACVNAPDKVVSKRIFSYGGGTGQTPIFYAAFHGDLAMVKKLLECKALVNIQSELNKNTPLHELLYGLNCYKSDLFECRENVCCQRIDLYLETFRVLLAHGSDPYVKNSPTDKSPGYSVFDMIQTDAYLPHVGHDVLNALKETLSKKRSS